MRFLLTLDEHFCTVCVYHILHSISFISDAQISDEHRLPAFNGELNGLLGGGLLASTDRSTMSESTRLMSTDISSGQDTQIM